jgi:hypothetical protein
MGLGLTFFKFIDREYYKDIPLSNLCVNFIFQRVLRINAEFSYSLNFTNRIIGYQYMSIPSSSLLSFAMSGGCYIVASKLGRLTIGENVIFAHNVCIQTINHGLEDRKKYEHKPVIIGDNCWLANSVTILPGIVLGDNVIVGANSIVTKSFPSNVVIAGNPANVIKELP